MTVGFGATSVLNKWLDVIRTGGATFTATTNVYIQIHTGDPGAAGTSNVSAGSTTRAVVNHNAPSAGSMTITGTNPAYTNGGTSETITHISAWTASSGGTFLYSGALSASKAWSSGDTLTVTTLTVSVTPAAA